MNHEFRKEDGMNFCSKHQFGGDTCFTCHIEKIADLERKLAEETKAREYAELTRGEFRESFQDMVTKNTELEHDLKTAMAWASECEAKLVSMAKHLDSAIGELRRKLAETSSNYSHLLEDREKDDGLMDELNRKLARAIEIGFSLLDPNGNADFDQCDRDLEKLRLINTKS